MLHILNNVTDTTNVFCFIESKHSALNAMCYLYQVKHCKTSTMLFLNYVKQNSRIALCVNVNQNANNKECFLNHVTQKTNNDSLLIKLRIMH